MQINSAGQVVLKRKAAWRDRTTRIVMSPLEFMQRRAALVQVRLQELLRVHHETIEAWIPEQAGIVFDAKAAPGGLRLATDLQFSRIRQQANINIQIYIYFKNETD